MTVKLKVPETSVEYVAAEITSPTTVDNGWTVALAFIPQTQKRPEAGDWETAEWEGNDVRTIIGPGTAVVLTCGKYDVWVRIDATPESAVRKAGTLEIY